MFSGSSTTYEFKSLIVLALALIVLGPKRLPGAGGAMGRSLREFKDAVSGDRADDALQATTEPRLGVRPS